MQTYLFYDIETTGLNKCFDQVLTFAGIRTDLSFREIDRHEVSIKLRPDVIMSPMALLTHRISIPEAMEGICEYEAIRQIHTWMNAPKTISLGYNTLGFDDEFLRFSFHRNLLTPYTHQYDNGCKRMDMLPFAVIYRLYSEGTLIWPEVNGKPTLKLEHLNAANNLAVGRSHEAMADVEATVALAKKFSQKEKIWEFLVGYFDKKTDRERLLDLPEVLRSSTGQHHQGILVAPEMGKDALYQAPVLSLGPSIPYSNQLLWLRLDLPELKDITAGTPDKAWVIRKKLGEPPLLLPPKERYWQRLSQERRDMVAANLAFLSEHRDIFDAIIDYHRNYRYPEIPNLDPDAALYQMGFLPPQESARCKRFHELPLHEKSDAVSGFLQPETRALASRLLLRNYPLAAAPDDAWAKYITKVNPASEEEALLDYRGEKRVTPVGALAEIDRIRKENSIDEEQVRLLEELEEYLTETFSVDG